MAVRKVMTSALRLVPDHERLERQLAEAQALAQLGSWEWDLLTDTITWSDELYRLHGVSQGAFQPTPVNILALQHPEDRQRVQEMVERSLRDNTPYVVEHRIVRPDGQVRVWQSRGSVVVDRASRPVKMHGIGQDITERRQAEAALRDAEAKYRALVEQAVEGMFRTTADGRFLMANAALARMLGYESPEQLIAERTDLERQHYVIPGERARFRHLVDMQGFVTGFEYEAYRRDGSTMWLRDHVRLVREPGGLTFYEGTVEDVTNHHRAEELLGLRVRQQAAVARFGEAAALGGDLRGLLDCAASIIADTLHVEYAHVLELRPDQTLLMRAGTGWRGDAGPVGVGAGRESQAGLTLLTGRPVVVEDARTETRCRLSPHLQAHGIASGITVIIGSPSRPFGVLGAHSIAARAFTPDDVTFLQAVASLLAAAIDRARAEDVRQHLLARAISAQEEERQRVARELHDETGQALTAILVGLRNVETAAAGTPAQPLATGLRQLVATTLRDVGRIARGLRPSALDDLGLIPALQRYGDELAASRALSVHIGGDASERFPHAVETTLYRIVQEALTNVARHARAQVARVAVERREGHARAVVSDDGSGFDVDSALHPAARRRPLGLLGMHERARLVGGSVTIASRRGAGTTITVDLPLGRAP